jgi:hypothetical protein
MLRGVTWWKLADISEVRSASIIKMMIVRLHGATTQETVVSLA